MNNFLPDNYEKPASANRYYKFQSGDNNFRILSPAITGWIDWQDTQDGRKPIRTKTKTAPINPAKPIKHFWAFAIWDYKEKNIKILEITQSTIQDAIFNLHNSEAWGSPTAYDLNVKREGEDLQTKYTVIPNPPAPLNADIAKQYSEIDINLDKLYSGGDPFAGTGNTEEINVDNLPLS